MDYSMQTHMTRKHGNLFFEKPVLKVQHVQDKHFIYSEKKSSSFYFNVVVFFLLLLLKKTCHILK